MEFFHKLTHSLGPSAFQSARFYRPWVQQQSSTGAGHKTRRDAGDSGSGHVEFKIGHRYSNVAIGNPLEMKVWMGNHQAKWGIFQIFQLAVFDCQMVARIFESWLDHHFPVTLGVHPSFGAHVMTRQLDAAGHFFGYFSGLKRHKEVAIDEQCAFFFVFLGTSEVPNLEKLR